MSRPEPEAEGAPASRFRIVREIARGGMGRVVEAVDLHLGRTVALKQVIDDDPEMRMRFEREVAITARLEHPSIVPIYDAGESATGERFYVMRKVTGAPLDVLLRAAPTLDDRLVYLPNLLAVANAVAHAHGRGVIHRDLKPENVMVGAFGEVYVMDWGVAQDGRDLEAAVVGTPGFMAPEQVRAEPTDARADVYALGACLYHVLAGKPPFHGSSETEVLDRTIAGAPEPLALLVPGVPPDLATIVEKAMRREPVARYLDAGGLAEELRRFLSGQLVASHRYGAGQRLVRWLRRHRALVIAIAVALAALVAVGVIALRRVLAEQRRAEVAAIEAKQRADDIIVTQAMALVDTDPTLAIATLRHLPRESPRWSRLGPTIAAARARGVALGFPGHPAGGTRIAFAPGPNDHRVLTTGGGVVHLHDLAARTSRVLASGEAMFAEWAGGLVIVTGRPLPVSPYLLDPATGATAAFPSPREIVSSSGAPGVAIFVDEAKQVFALDLGAGLPLAATPVAIPVDLKPGYSWLSPSGRVLTLSDDARTLILRADPGSKTSWRVVKELAFASRTQAIDRAETRLAFAHGDDVATREVVELDVATLAVTRRWPTQFALALVYADGELYEQHYVPNEIRVLLDAGVARTLWQYETAAGPSVSDANGALVAKTEPRRIEVSRGSERHTIFAPSVVSTIAASPDGRYLLGSTTGTMLVWELAPILSERIAAPPAPALGFVAPGKLLAIGDYDGQRGLPVHEHTLGERPFRIDDRVTRTVPVESDPDFLPGGVVIVRRVPDGVVAFVEPPIQPAIQNMVEVAVIDERAVIVGTMVGTVHRVDRETGAASLVATLGGRVLALTARGGWIAAQSNDGSLWRRDPGGREERQVLMPALQGVALTSRGDLVVAREGSIAIWPVGGTPAEAAKLHVRAGHLRSVEGDRVAMQTADNALFVFDPATREVQQALPAGPALRYADDGSIAVNSVDGGIAITDFRTGDRWTVADKLFVMPDGLALSPDGAVLIAVEDVPRGSDRMHRFSLTVAGDLHAWVQRATNADKPLLSRATIQWRPLDALAR